MKARNAEKETQADDALLLGACCSALATLVPVAMYQTGALSRLPDPPLKVFASDRITMSKAAHPFGIPDGLLGLVSFSTTLTLAILGRHRRMARRLLGAKLVFDASAAVFNAGRQIFSFGKLCSWCTGTAISAGVMAYAGRDAVHDTLRSCEHWAGKTAAACPRYLRTAPAPRSCGIELSAPARLTPAKAPLLRK